MPVGVSAATANSSDSADPGQGTAFGACRRWGCRSRAHHRLIPPSPPRSCVRVTDECDGQHGHAILTWTRARLMRSARVIDQRKGGFGDDNSDPRDPQRRPGDRMGRLVREAPSRGRPNQVAWVTNSRSGSGSFLPEDHDATGAGRGERAEVEDTCEDVAVFVPGNTDPTGALTPEGRDARRRG